MPASRELEIFCRTSATFLTNLLQRPDPNQAAKRQIHISVDAEDRRIAQPAPAADGHRRAHALAGYAHNVHNVRNVRIRFPARNLRHPASPYTASGPSA